MAEYIEKDALYAKLSRMIDYCKTHDKVNGLSVLFQVGDAIMDCETVEVTPVRRGRWVEIVENGIGWWMECSECGERWMMDSHEHICVVTPFCPHCGARMRFDEAAVREKNS